MIKKMLLEEKELHFSKSDLPLLIHGDDGYGASLFSVSVLADLYASGADIVFLCGYHMARDEFESQTQSKDDSILATDIFNLNLIKTKRVIFIPNEKPELLSKVLDSLDNLDERVVFFKNFDLFGTDVFSVIKDLPNVVMMGNIDKCSYKTELLDKKWTSQLYFSMPQTEVHVVVPEIARYKGYLKSCNNEGIVSLAQ